MKKNLTVDFFLSLGLASLILFALPTSVLAGGVLQFKSGFEANTYISGTYIKGTDYSAPSGINNWDKIPDYVPWVVQTTAYFQGGSMEISQDPTNPNNRVLHFHNTQNGGGDRSRTQWSLKQVPSWTDPGGPNLFDKQFIRYRLYIPGRIKTVFSYGEYAKWYMIWESHGWVSENTYYRIYIRKKANSNHWYFRVVQQRPENNNIWENTANQDIAVPFDEWFTFEVFLKYHETDGEFYVAIVRQGSPRQVVAHYKGRTKFDTKLRDLMVFKMYHEAIYLDRLKASGYDGTHQYYDDFEIWSDYPTAPSPGPSPTPTPTGYPTSTPTLRPSPTPTSQLTPTPSPTPGVLPGLSWEAEEGEITSPFTITSGYVSQSVSTDVSSGGRALYRFNLPFAGEFVVKTIVDTPGEGSNSFFVNIDGEPVSPSMTWDIVELTTGFEERLVSWRGNGTFDNPEFAPKIFTLSSGEHTLIIRGREADARLDKVSISLAFPLSQGWNQITWPNISGIKASNVSQECPIAVSQENFWFRPYVKNYGGMNFNFENGKTYHLKCGQAIIWNL